MCLKNEVVLSIIHSFFIVMCRQCKYDCLKRKIKTEKTKDRFNANIASLRIACLPLSATGQNGHFRCTRT